MYVEKSNGNRLTKSLKKVMEIQKFVDSICEEGDTVKLVESDQNLIIALRDPPNSSAILIESNDHIPSTIHAMLSHAIVPLFDRTSVDDKLGVRKKLCEAVALLAQLVHSIDVPSVTLAID